MQYYRVHTEKISSPFVFTEEEAQGRAVRMEKLTGVEHYIWPAGAVRQEEVYDASIYGEGNMRLEELQLTLDILERKRR